MPATQNTSVPSLKSSLQKSALGLLAFAIITAGLVSFTHLSTQDLIDANLSQAKLQRLNELAPAPEFSLNLEQQLILPAAPHLGQTQDFAAHLAMRNSEPAILLVPLSTQEGYTGTIQALLAVRLHKDSASETNSYSLEVQGLRVTAHQETPGLGDKIEIAKSDWIESFVGTSLEQPQLKHWAVKKDGGHFDEFTGATITPRALVNLVRDSLLWLESLDLAQLLDSQLAKQATDKPVEETLEKPVEETLEKSIEKPIEKIAEKNTNSPQENAHD